ncbi:GPRNNA1 [Trypoxylus dichotomus]
MTAENMDNDTCVLDEPYTTIAYTFFTNSVLLNLFGFFGLLGNIISMIILSRPQMRSSINYLLIGLARVDTVLIITSILLFGLYGIYPYTGYMFTYYYKIQPHMGSTLYFLTTVCHTASTYLTVTVSFDRFVAVCKPLKARSLCTYGRARIYVISVLIFAIIYNMPRLWESEICTDYHPVMNVTIYCVRMTPLRDSDNYKAIYVTWFYFVFMHLIPCVSLLVLNVCIYRQVRQANREIQRLSRLQRREIGLATMLLCVVLVFFICNLLPLIINIIELFNIIIDVDILQCMIATSNLLVTINSSVNFIIYVTFGEKFQRLFLLLFCSRGIFLGMGRDSPEATGHDDSLMSNGNRNSLRFHRYNASLNRNGVSSSIRSNGTLREKRNRTNSPAPCVYYPANKVQREISAVAFTTQTSVTTSDWDTSTTSTTGF